MDLIDLKNIIQKTPSYKSQIKGQRKKDFDKLFEKLTTKVVESNTNLEQLFHNHFNQVNDSGTHSPKNYFLETDVELFL